MKSSLTAPATERLWSTVGIVRPPPPTPGIVTLDGVVELFRLLVAALAVADDHPVSVAVESLQRYFP